jgi:hypothetical protein
MRIRVEMDGLFGIGTSHMSWCGFAVHAVDWEKPFLSETGYRSFLGAGGALAPGYGPDRFAAAIIDGHVQRELRGGLCQIGAKHLTR